MDPTWTRLEDQIEWYDCKGGEAQRTYRRFKLVEVIFGALIPFLAGFQDNLRPVLAPDFDLLPAVLIALLGVGVVVLEGLQHFNQYHQIWLRYRSTCEALQREKSSSWPTPAPTLRPTTSAPSSPNGSRRCSRTSTPDGSRRACAGPGAAPRYDPG